MQKFDQVPIENVKAYWDSRPCNVRHSDKPIGSREYYDEVERRKYFVEPHIPSFADFDRWAGKEVLEIGCGIGTDTIRFARAGAKVTAVDLSEESLALARRRAEVFGLTDSIEFVRADAEQLDEFVTPRPFDLLYTFGVLHHTPHPGRAFAAVRRFAGPETELRAMVYNRWSWKTIELVLREGRGNFRRLDEIVARSSEAQEGCPVTYTYTPRTITTLLASVGFRVRSTSIDHIFPYDVAAYREYRYEKRFPFNKLSDATMRALEQRLGWHLCVVADPT